MATHFSVLAWKTSETEESGGLPFTGGTKVTYQQYTLVWGIACKLGREQDGGGKRGWGGRMRIKMLNSSCCWEMGERSCHRNCASLGSDKAQEEIGLVY